MLKICKQDKKHDSLLFCLFKYLQLQENIVKKKTKKTNKLSGIIWCKILIH